jgi:hypothetical protein
MEKGFIKRILAKSNINLVNAVLINDESPTADDAVLSEWNCNLAYFRSTEGDVPVPGGL